jgi:predicted TPR repeat methyltransferase
MHGFNIRPFLISPQSLPSQQVTSKVYDHVEVSDCEAYARRQERGSVTAALAGDVLCYYGDLGPLFGAVADALMSDGLFAFTVEALAAHEGAKDGYVLRSSARFAHSRAYVARTAAESGLVLVGAARGGSRESALGETPVHLRLQGGKPVLGTVYVFAKKN